MINGKLKHHVWRNPTVKDLTKAKDFPNLLILEFKYSIIHNKALLILSKAIYMIKQNRPQIPQKG